jgi:hypothetical protein
LRNICDANSAERVEDRAGSCESDSNGRSCALVVLRVRRGSGMVTSLLTVRGVPWGTPRLTKSGDTQSIFSKTDSSGFVVFQSVSYTIALRCLPQTHRRLTFFFACKRNMTTLFLINRIRRWPASCASGRDTVHTDGPEGEHLAKILFAFCSPYG